MSCINFKHPEVIKIAGELNILPAVAAAKIGVWQSKNNIEDRFPTVDELNNIKTGVNDVFKENPELANISTQQLYSQYLSQNPNGSVEQFKSWVDSRNNQLNSDSLFGLNTQNQEQLEFHVNTLNVVSQFLENIGIEQRLVPEFLSQNGSVVEGAIAAANFIEGTVDIIDDLEKGRAEAWNKLPEEAAHFWYRLLKEDSPLKKALWESHQTALKNDELYAGQYGKLVKSPSDLTEESIGQLIAEAIKRIETKNANASDYSFFKKFLEWINSIINIFKNTTQDPFEVAAMKILFSDMSDLMTWEEYRKLNNIVNFADILTEQSVAPIDYTLIEDIGFIGSTFMEDTEGNATSGYRFHFRDSDWIKKYGDSSPSFYTQEELDNWVSANIKEHNQRQKQILQEVRDNQVFFDRLLNKSFRKKSKFLPKTLRKYFDIIDAQNLNPLREWNISQELLQITKKLTPEEKKQIVETNGYTNIAPTLKVLPDLLQKYRKNPIVLSETIKIDGAKKQELSILNGIKEMIKLENPNLKSITAEEFVNEAHNWLQTNYLLGFANEKTYLSYRTDQTFSYLSDRQSNEDVDITNMTEEELQRLPFEERQRIANIVGLTKQNPDVYHNKVSLRFNDSYHADYGQDANHFAKRPSAWGNLTYFYTGKNKWKDAVLLHEIQNDNIEALRNFKTEKVDLETSLGRYLQQLNTDLLDNITQIESGGKKIIKNNVWSTNPPKQHLQLNYQLEQLKNLPLEQGLQQLKQRLNESIELHKSDTSKDINKAQEAIDKAYSQRRIFQDFQKRGGIKSLLKKEELQDLEDILKRLNTEEVEGEAQWLPEENQFEPGFPSIRDLKQKKQDFKFKTIELQAKITRELQKIYGDNAPLISLTAPAKPLPKSQRNMRTVGYGQNQRRIGGASQELNENVNWLLAYSEKKILDGLSKTIEESKKNYIIARNTTNGYNFNVSLSKITPEQYATLIENYKYNEDLLNRLIDEQAQEDVKKESIDISKLTDAEIEKDIIGEYEEPNEIDGTAGSGFRYKNMYLSLNATTKKEAIQEIRDRYDSSKQIEKEKQKLETLKQKALDKKAELEKNYGKIEEEVKQTLEIEMNYFTPLVHHLIQKHINQYGKDFPMYFSGYNITKLTQGNDRTAMIYAGKDEIDIVDKQDFFINGKGFRKFNDGSIIITDAIIDSNGKILGRQNSVKGTQQEYEKAYQQATEQRAKEIKYQAAQQIGLIPLVSYNEKVSLEEGIKKLNEYKKQSKQNLDRVINTIMNISDSKPVETGAIYNAMSQISGIKLIWQDKIDGLKGNAGGYLVDLTNYNYNVPILYGLQNNKLQESNSFQQFQQSLNKPNTNPILKGNQGEQVKKFAELQERLNNKEFLEGAKNAFESSEELQQFGTQEQYNDYIARVSLGIIKNPSSGEYNYDSKVKDIVYHGGYINKDDTFKLGDGEFGKGIYFAYEEAADNYRNVFGDAPNLISALINLKNPVEFDDSKGSKKTSFNFIKEKLSKNINNDGTIYISKKLIGNDMMVSENFNDEFKVNSPEQIHILGSKQDVEGFKKFVKESSKPKVSQITDEFGNTWNEIELTSEQSNTILLNKKDLSENESDNNESIFNEKIVENTDTINNHFDTNKKLLFGQEEINKSFTAQDVLNNIIESDITLSKAGTELVLKAMSLLKNANTRVKVISQERFDQLTKDTQGDGIAVMAYNYDLGNNIYITEKSLQMFKPELIIESFIHEVAHNISIKALINPETYQEKEFHDFIKKAFEQYKFLAKKLNDAKSYGFTNEKEFVAEIYSNAQFREELQQIDKSFWRKFIDEIRRLFGLPKSLQNDNLIDSILLLETVDNFINTNTNVPSILFKNDYSKSFSNTDFKIVKEAETYDLTTIDKKVEHLVNQAKSKVAELINRTKKSTKEKAQEFLEEYKKLEKELDEVSTISQWKAVTSYMVSFQTTINKLQKSLNDRFKIQEVTYNGVVYTKVKNAEVFKSENGDYITPEDFKDKIQKEFFESKPFIVDSELYNSIENEGIKQLSTKDFTELAVNYENYLASYDLLEDVKKLLSDTVKDATLSREDKLEIKNLNNKLNEIIEPHDKLIAQLKKIKKESFIKLLADSSNNKKVINKWKNKLAVEYKKLVNPKESEIEWIGYQMNNVYAEQIQKDLLEEAEKIVNNPYIDITKFSKNWVDLLNINSPLSSIMSNIVGKMRDKIITEISEIVFTFDKYFTDYSKFNNSTSMSGKHGNLVELNESDDTYYLKGKYSIKFKESFNKLVAKLIEDNKDVENYDYKKDKLYKNWIAENTKPDGFGNKIPQDKWLNKGLTKEELKVLNFFTKLTKENNENIYHGKGGLYSTFFGAEYYKLPSKTKSNKERTFEGDIKGQLKDAVSDLKETKVDDINYGQAFDSRGEELRRIRINFRGKLDSKDQSLDLFTLYRAEQSNAITYKHRSKDETKLKLFIDIAKDKQYKRKSLLDGKWAKNIFAKEKVKGQLFSGEFSNEVEKLKGILETALYDVTSYDEQKLLGKFDANKLTSKINGITATISMTLNIGSSTVNFLNGEMMMSMLRIGGKYTNKANQTKAHANYFANLHNILADISNPVKKSFHNQMLNMFDVIGGHNINKQDFLNNSAVKEILSSHNLNFTNESVEHMLNSILTESILRSTPVLNADYKYIDKEGNVTTKENAASLFDMLYLDKNGLLKAKDLFKYTEYNLVNDYHQDGKQSLNYLVKQKVQNLYGVYDNNMKAEIAKHWYGKLLLMFKDFFMSQAIYRYKGMTTANKSKDELDDEDLTFNNAEQEFTEGIYTTVVRTFFPLLKGFNIAMVKENFNNLTDYEKSNLKQAFFEVGLTAIILPLLGAILAASAGGGDDDDLYFYLFVFRRLESELSQFRNLPELNRMITNPVAANRFLQNGFTVIEDIMTPINFTPKNNESYFDWFSENQKGENIMLNNAFKLAPGRSLFMNTYKQRFTLMDR